MRKYKTIMELIFIFIIPIILILSGLNLKEEQITTSTGYEWNTYIEYNNKILINTNVYKNTINNFNKYNGNDTELGYYNVNTGEPIASNTRIRTINPIEVNTNETMYAYNSNTGNPTLSIFFYDSNMNYLSWTQINNATFNVPNNCKYIHVCTYDGYGTIYKNDICINISVSWANGNYTEYGKPLIIYSQTDISGQNDIVYTPFGTIKNLILNNFEIKQTITTDILFDYTILWFSMFILWHVLYLFFDMLIHLFIDWGHKEKEKING